MKGVTDAQEALEHTDQSFNPHAREGRDRTSARHRQLRACFNPHAREGRDQGCSIEAHERSCFNPHAREGRDLDGDRVVITDVVSIHTPVKGVTTIANDVEGNPIVSIHTPVKGVTLSRLQALQMYLCFNPHAREGRDTIENDIRHSGKLFQSTRP